MGLTTHVLDTMHGCPAQGMEVALYATEGDDATLIRRFALNHDGRSDQPLYTAQDLKIGTYRLVFDVAGYFRQRGVALPEPFPEPGQPGLRRGAHGPALSRAAAGQPLELLHVSRLMTPGGRRPGSGYS